MALHGSKLGERRADRYIRGIYKTMEKALGDRSIWRKVDHDEISGIFFITYKRHFIFFRESPESGIGIVSILHERMDIPNRLKEDIR